MRAMMGWVTLLVVNVGVSAEDKKTAIDAKKLVGRWETKEKTSGSAYVMEFNKSGGATFTPGGSRKDDPTVGTYKVEGNKLSMTARTGGQARTWVRSVSKLTDSELHSTDEHGKEVILMRIIEK